LTNNILKPSEYRSIQQFFQIKQKGLVKIMANYLSSKYETVYATKDYVIAVGDIPVALVAHLDTVFTTPPHNIFYDREKNVMWSPDGLGADDRAGVYSIVQIIKQGYRPTVIFTTDEEKGALGAEALIKDYPEAPMDLKYMIQLDRRGCDDCVFYDCNNPKFEEYVETFGFITAWGTFSDISVLCPQWGVAGVNLSIGYINEHSCSEILYIGHMLATINKVKKMLEDIDNAELFEYIPLYYTYTKTAYGYDFSDYGWDPSYGISKALWKSWHTPDDLMKCDRCKIEDYDYNLFPVKRPDGITIFLCSDCMANNQQILWCEKCQEAYVAKDGDNLERTLCYDCEKEIGV
jgi:hypothetical protein